MVGGLPPVSLPDFLLCACTVVWFCCVCEWLAHVHALPALVSYGCTHLPACAGAAACLHHLALTLPRSYMLGMLPCPAVQR
jgi:hypothetical protein